MKLYTEEQVRKAIAVGYDWCHQKHIPDDWMIDNFINSLTPIELPTDEEIVNKALEIQWSNTLFKDGAKYVIDKIKGGNK